MASTESNSESDVSESLVLSCSESDYEVFREEDESSIDQENAGEILPYRFEPVAEDVREVSPVRPDEGEQNQSGFVPMDVARLQNTEWYVVCITLCITGSHNKQ